jgi:hypothetical protein
MGMSRKTKQIRNELQDGTNVHCEICDYTDNIGAIGILKTGLKKNLEFLPGKHLVDSVRETAVLGKWHILQKELQSET